MYFSNSVPFKKFMSLLLAVLMLASLFAGCKKEETPESTEPNAAPGLNLQESTPPTESTAPVETVPVENKENMATVLTQLTVRSFPSKESNPVATLDAGTQVEILRRETALGIDWGLIQQGWIVMDYVQMNVVSEDPSETTEPSEPASTDTPTEESIRGMINVNGLNIREEANTNSKVMGTYNKGDVVTVLETKDGWGRTNKGWIKMEYISTGTSNNEETKPNNTTGNGSTTVVGKGIVTASQLNIRDSASTDGERLGAYRKGDRVEILEKSGNWGRTNKGWISLEYVYQDGTTGKNTAKGIVTGTNLNIRSGPGTKYDSVGSLNAGARVSILEQFTYDGVTWGCIDKGWISLAYVYIDGTGEDVQYGTVTGDQLNIRSGPGTNYGSVGSLNSGDEVEILFTIEVGDVTWGNIEKGWISMDYVDLD